MKLTLVSAIANFGAAAQSKLTNPGVTGEPEDQLRAPFERLLGNLAELTGIGRSKVVPVGESTLGDLKTRPDYAVTIDGALVGFIEPKAPGKGANPNRFRDPHDKSQWEKLRSLPNLLYPDGNSFFLWQDGKAVSHVVTLVGDIATSGNKLAPAPGLMALSESSSRGIPLRRAVRKSLRIRLPVFAGSPRHRRDRRPFALPRASRKTSLHLDCASRSPPTAVRSNRQLLSVGQ
jgi:hypothetical protein